MQPDKEKFKSEFKKRLYKFVLKLIDFIDRLPKDNVSRRIGDQLLRDSKRAKHEDVQWFLDELNEYAKIFASSILTAKGKRTI